VSQVQTKRGSEGETTRALKRLGHSGLLLDEYEGASALQISAAPWATLSQEKVANEVIHPDASNIQLLWYVIKDSGSA